MPRISLIDPVRRDRNAIAFDEMICRECLEHQLTRSQARLRLFDELGVELITQNSVDGWWFAVAIEPLARSWCSYCLFQETSELEDILENARAQRLHYDDELSGAVPDPIDDIVIPELIENELEPFDGAPQVMAAEKEDAEMGLLALLLDDHVQVAFTDRDIERLLPNDPRPYEGDECDFWRWKIGESVVDTVKPTLIEINNHLEWQEDDWRWREYEFTTGMFRPVC